jgi:hypothetical protein
MWDKNRKARILFFCLPSFCLFVTSLHAAEPIANSIGRIEGGFIAFSSSSKLTAPPS